MTRNPYGPPRGPARVRARRARSLLWWALLLAPYLGFVLLLAGSRALYEIGRPVSDVFREGLIETSSAWASASVLAAFLFPAAWVLEQIVGRARLALPILVVGLYVLGSVEVLERLGYVADEHLVIQLVKIVTGLFTFAFVPLAIVWAIVGFRRRRRQ